MQMKKASAQSCQICQLPWQTCMDPTYTHQPRAKASHQEQSYASSWQDPWNYQQWDQSQSSTKQAKSPRHRPRAQPRGGHGQDAQGMMNQPEMMMHGGMRKGNFFLQAPLPPSVPWTPMHSMTAPMPPPMQPPPMAHMQNMHVPQLQSMPAPMPMMPTAPAQTGGPTMGQTTSATPMMPCPQLHPLQLPAADAKLWAYLRQCKPDLPVDVQQENAKREGVKSTQDLFTAANQMPQAKEDYEQALLGPSQHLQAWKAFLAKAVSDWQELQSSSCSTKKTYKIASPSRRSSS